MQIIVRDNNVEQALRALKKKLQREGVYREMKLRRHYEKPSEKRAREKAAAVRRARKMDRKRMERDGIKAKVAAALDPCRQLGQRGVERKPPRPFRLPNLYQEQQEYEPMTEITVSPCNRSPRARCSSCGWACCRCALAAGIAWAAMPARA